MTASLQVVPVLHAGLQAQHRLEQLSEQLRSPGGTEPAREMTRLAQCVTPPDPDTYTKRLEDLHKAYDERRRQKEAEKLFQLLTDQHPALADDLGSTCSDPAWPQRLNDLQDAWAWATASRYLAADTRERDHDSAERELEQAERQLDKTTAELAAAKAWKHLLARMTQAQRQSLLAFKHRMSDLGKGTTAAIWPRSSCSAASSKGLCSTPPAPGCLEAPDKTFPASSTLFYNSRIGTSGSAPTSSNIRATPSASTATSFIPTLSLKWTGKHLAATPSPSPGPS